MGFILANILIAMTLFSVMLAVQEWGKRLGERHRSPDSPGEALGYRATEGAVFALLGLFLAFTFSGAGARFETRTHLIVQEANAIETAWSRIDLLPSDAQPAVRALFREYVDARLEIYGLASVGRPVETAVAKSVSLRQQIWSASVSAIRQNSPGTPTTLLLSALNELSDIATRRNAAGRTHAHPVIYVMIGVLAVISSAFVGYGMAGRKGRSVIHFLGFAAVLAVVLYVIIDLDFPRVGLIRIDPADQILLDVRRGMS